MIGGNGPGHLNRYDRRYKVGMIMNYPSETGRVLTVRMNDASFEYDVRSLLRAFFPHTRICFMPTEDGSEDSGAQPDIDLMIFITEEMITVFCGEEYDEKTGGGERASIKNKLKCLLYDIYAGKTGRRLPWGTLTGIRPTKLALTRVREGASQEEVTVFMKEKYRTSAEKAGLAYDIAKREWDIIREVPAEAYSLYVGIPFCPSICLYCSFSSYPVNRYAEKTDAYLDALFLELEETAAIFAERPLSTIYIGGGTPTSLSAEQLQRLMTKLAELFPTETVREWTLEAGRADSITQDKLLAIRSFGDVRISINPQTFHQETLDRIGRRHTVEDVKWAFSLAREMGFSNINMDIIVGLPKETDHEVAKTLEEVLTLRPDNLTVHSLALKRASRLHEEWERYKEDTFHHSSKIMDMVALAAREMGMSPYYLYRQKDIAGNLENTGFAPEGKEGVYNILMMEDVQDIAACGAGAISKRITGAARPVRAANVKDVDQYIVRIREMMSRKRELFGMSERVV